MIAGLGRFVAELRDAGFRVSPAEWIEAVRAVEWIGLADRERFRAALRTTLAKRSQQQAVFDEVFDRFFAAPGRRGDRGERAGELRAGRRRGRREALLSALREASARRLGRLRRVVTSEATPERRQAGPTAPARRELHRRLDAAAEREIAAAIPRLIERIRLRTARRKRCAPHGRLYLRRVFRENLASGGVPFVLPRQRRLRRRSRVFLMIDVSWSTTRAAGLFLAVADEFLRRARDVRVSFFVNRAVDAGAAVERWLRSKPRAAGVGSSFAAHVAELPGIDLTAPSDYGRAFHGLLRCPRPPSGRNTLLVVLGDGRTNRFDPQEWVFEEIAERCGAVLWLVPEPVALWGTADSALDRYLPHVDVAVEAFDLDGLARGVSEMARRIRA